MSKSVFRSMGRLAGAAVIAICSMQVYPILAFADAPRVERLSANAPGMITITWLHPLEDEGLALFLVEQEHPYAFWKPDIDKRAWSVTGLQPSTTYRYRVCAVYESNPEPDCSDYVSVRTMDPPRNGSGRPPAPRVVHTDSWSTSIGVRWEANHDYDKYFINFTLKPLPGERQQGPITKEEPDDGDWGYQRQSGLLPNRTYIINVQGCDEGILDDSCYDWSAPYEARTILFTEWKLLDNVRATANIIADGDNLYQLHSSGWVFKYTGTPGAWQPLDTNRDTKEIVAGGGNLYQRHADGWIFKYVGTPAWQPLDSNNRTVKIVADGSNLYQLHNNGWVFKYTGTPTCTLPEWNRCWQAISSNKETKDIVASGGSIYKRHSDGSIYVYNGTPPDGWQILDDNAATVQIVTDGAHLYQRHNDGWIFERDSGGNWRPLDNNGDTKDIVAGGGHLYQRHGDGWMFRYTGTPMTGWEPLDNNEATVQMVAGNRLYQRHNNGAVFVSTKP